MSHNNELQMCQSKKQIIQQQPTKQIVLNYHILQLPQPLVSYVPFKLIHAQISNNMINLTLQA